MFLHVLSSVFALAIAAGPSGFVSPPEDLLHQLQKLNRARPWIRVTTDSSRLTLRAGRIDASGLGELSSRKPDPPAAVDIPWRSIARIDGPAPRDNVKLGALVGVLGIAMTAFNGGGESSVLIPLAVVSGGVGLWRSGLFKTQKERLWYSGTALAPAPVVMQAPESTSTVAMQAPESTSVSAPDVTPTATDTAAALVALPASADSSVSPRIDRARARIRARELIRMHSVFGSFQGFASAVGPRGLEGLSTDLRRPRKYQDAAPSGLVWWEQIDYVEKKETSFARGAFAGGLGMFATVGLFAYMVGGLAAGAGGDVDPEHFALASGAIAGGIGAILGGMWGGSVPSWRRVYERP